MRGGMSIRKAIAAGILLWIAALVVGHAIIYHNATAKAPLRYIIADIWYTYPASCMLVVVVAGSWLLFGAVGYVIMHYCDTAAGVPLNRKEYFIFGNHPVFAFCISLILGVVTLVASRSALEAWRKYTQELQSEIARVKIR